MHHELIIAGFGGQGVVLAGQVLATAGLQAGKHVVWTPSYGPEMRGGESHCTVIISSSPIGSPVVCQADSALLLDRRSARKFAPQVKPGGLVVVNSSLVPQGTGREDVQEVAVPANHLAEGVGDARVANLVMVGALVALRPVVSAQQVARALRAVLPERHHALLPLNEAALEAGRQAVRSQQ